MPNEELSGQITALEVVAMTALGLYLANSRNDPDYQKAGALIDMRQSVEQKAHDLPLLNVHMQSGTAIVC
jgi:hypothetical protein